MEQSFDQPEEEEKWEYRQKSVLNQRARIAEEPVAKQANLEEVNQRQQLHSDMSRSVDRLRRSECLRYWVVSASRE